MHQAFQKLCQNFDSTTPQNFDSVPIALLQTSAQVDVHILIRCKDISALYYISPTYNNEKYYFYLQKFYQNNKKFKI